MEMEEVKTIDINNKNYPELLKKITNPPKVLYFRGEIFPEENCFAVVGTRRCSSYGKQMASEIAGDLAESGLTIVSGLAPGIDTAAHQAAVERKKRTIAVLGTGVDNKSIYPRENLKLAEEILKNNGCLISEYPPGTPGSKFTFPQRNRIISGLSTGILVVEAKEKSGALITADWARKQQRKIFAVPGNVHSLNSKGCHFLIKRGAKLTENAYDVLRELSSPKELNLPHLTSEAKQRPGETKEENLVLETLKEGSLYVDKIIEKTSLPAPIVAGTLANLEIQGKVKNLGGNIYALAR